jgi:hypothetical protein
MHPWGGSLFFLDLSRIVPTRHNLLANITLVLF